MMCATFWQVVTVLVVGGIVGAAVVAVTRAVLSVRYKGSR